MHASRSGGLGDREAIFETALRTAYRNPGRLLHLHGIPPPPFPAVVLPPLPLLLCATVPSSHSAALSLILHPSLPALHGVCLISLPVHPIARSARPTLPARRGGARPRRPALLPSPARREERRGKEAKFLCVLMTLWSAQLKKETPSLNLVWYLASLSCHAELLPT